VTWIKKTLKNVYYIYGVNDTWCVVHQQTVHLHCYGLAPENPAKDYWWGLELYNASRSLSVDDIIVINESSSILQNVDIMYAGVDPNHSPVPAIRASPSVPSMVNVTIQHVALDATNFTEVRSSTIIYNCTVSNCRGKLSCLWWINSCVQAVTNKLYKLYYYYWNRTQSTALKIN